MTLEEQLEEAREKVDTLVENSWVLFEEIDKLKEALKFYAERPIYEKLNQFSGDNEFVSCNGIAQEALASLRF